MCVCVRVRVRACGVRACVRARARARVCVSPCADEPLTSGRHRGHLALVKPDTGQTGEYWSKRTMLVKLEMNKS